MPPGMPRSCEAERPYCFRRVDVLVRNGCRYISEGGRIRALQWVRSRCRREAAALACVAALTSACSDPPHARDEFPQAGADTADGVVDWDGRAISLRPAGWTLKFCDGEGPFLCVEQGSEPIGSVELLRLPVERHSAVTGVIGRGGSELEALEAVAAEFVAVLSADRKIGHGADYQLRADRAAGQVVLGRPGLRLVVEGRVADRTLERIVQYYAIYRDSLYLLAASAMPGGGPLGEFSIDDLKAFEPLFAEVAAASRVSDGTGLRR
jgi:hypothetical protein